MRKLLSHVQYRPNNSGLIPSRKMITAVSLVSRQGFVSDIGRKQIKTLETEQIYGNADIIIM
jgi:hypothetical protein